MATLFSHSSYADYVYDGGNNITLTIPKSIILDVNPVENHFSKSADVSFSASSSSSRGYTLTINAKDASNNNDLVNGSNKLTSIPQKLSEADYLSSGGDNTWAYKPSKFNSLDNTDFLPGPTTTASTLNQTSTANSTADNYTISLATKVNDTILSGSYTNTFVFSLTANIPTYTINYIIGSLSTATNTPPSTTTITTTDSTIKLDSARPSDAGAYPDTFNGWCNNTVNKSTGCTGTTYQPGANFPLPNDSATINLYAIWQLSEENKKALCFATDTLVYTPNGLKPIEDIKEGDIVYSYDLDTYELKTDSVKEIYQNTSNELVKLTLDDGSIIQGTEYHPFYNWQDHGWDPLISFQAGSKIPTINGNTRTSRSLERINGQRDTYNLSTEKYYNYIIATSENDKFLVLSVPPEDVYQRLIEENPDIVAPQIMPIYRGDPLIYRSNP